MSEDLTIELGRRRALTSDQPVGWVYNDDNERVFSIKLHDTCTHAVEQRKAKACGHMWCPLCDGWVHPGTNVLLKGAGPVIKNNRELQNVAEYTHFFRETMAGSGRLTHAMKGRLKNLGRVAEPADLIRSHEHDVMNDRVFERRDKE